MQRYSTLVDYILCRRCKLKEVRDCNVVVAESVEPFSGWGRFRWQRHIGESCRQSWKRERVLQALRGWEKLPEDWISDSQWYQRAWLEVYLAWRSFQLGQKEIVRTYYNYQTDNCLTNIEEKLHHLYRSNISTLGQYWMLPQILEHWSGCCRIVSYYSSVFTYDKCFAQVSGSRSLIVQILAWRQHYGWVWNMYITFLLLNTCNSYSCFIILLSLIKSVYNGSVLSDCELYAH